MTEIRESKIEREASQYAESRGWTQIKIMKASKRGFPDRMYARKGVIVFVEFKKPGEVETKQQARRHDELRSEGFTVYVIDNMEVARAVFA